MCIAAKKEHDRLYREKACDKRREYNRRWRKEHSGYTRRWREEHREEISDYSRRQRYSLKAGEYEVILAQQEGVCTVCHQPETRRCAGGVMSLAVDHDHETGQVRGLLCNRCNTVVVKAIEDYPDLCRRAAVYLEQHKRKGGKRRG